MTIIAIDPGTLKSAFVIFDGHKILDKGIIENDQMLVKIQSGFSLHSLDNTILAIEMVASYGMPVGKEVFETVLWIGRFYQAWQSLSAGSSGRAESRPPQLVYRKDIKLHHCLSPRANDATIRQSLIDKYGAPGTKESPGLTYGLSKDLWSAFAITTYIHASKF